MRRYINIFSYTVPTYGFCISIAVVLCGALILYRARKVRLQFENMIILMAITLSAFLIGGSVTYFIVSYTPKQLLDFIINKDFSFMKNSGLVFYGGLIGGVVGALAASYILKLDRARLEYCIVPFVPLGHAIGRVGCILAGCCHGVSYNGIFAVYNGYANPPGMYFPIQVVESVLNMMLTIILLHFTRKIRKTYSVLLLYLISYSIIRFVLEFFRGDTIRGLACGLSTSQWISIVIFAMSLMSVFAKSLKNNHE